MPRVRYEPLHCKPDSDTSEGEEGAGHWCQESGMSHYTVNLTQIPQKEEKEPDTDAKSQVWAITLYSWLISPWRRRRSRTLMPRARYEPLHCKPDSDPPEGEEGAGHWCQEPGMSHYTVILSQIPLEETKEQDTDAKSQVWVITL
jgi:hypothetical protein